MFVHSSPWRFHHEIYDWRTGCWNYVTQTRIYSGYFYDINIHQRYLRYPVDVYNAAYIFISWFMEGTLIWHQCWRGRWTYISKLVPGRRSELVLGLLVLCCWFGQVKWIFKVDIKMIYCYTKTRPSSASWCIIHYNPIYLVWCIHNTSKRWPSERNLAIDWTGTNRAGWWRSSLELLSLAEACSLDPQSAWTICL